MNRRIAQIALLVADYDEAINFYTRKLGFVVVEDTILSPTKRWVVISPGSTTDCYLLLAKAATDEQRSRIGNQTGGRVFLFLFTDDLKRDYTGFLEKGVSFAREPKTESYGTVAVFKDLYGNLWDLIEPAEAES